MNGGKFELSDKDIIHENNLTKHINKAYRHGNQLQ